MLVEILAVAYATLLVTASEIHETRNEVATKERQFDIRHCGAEERDVHQIVSQNPCGWEIGQTRDKGSLLMKSLIMNPIKDSGKGTGALVSETEPEEAGP